MLCTLHIHPASSISLHISPLRYTLAASEISDDRSAVTATVILGSLSPRLSVYGKSPGRNRDKDAGGIRLEASDLRGEGGEAVRGVHPASRETQ